METLDEVTIHVSGRTKRNGERFHHGTQNGDQFKHTNYLFLKFFFHLISLDHGWLTVTETTESKTAHEAGPRYFGNKCLVSVSYFHYCHHCYCQFFSFFSYLYVLFPSNTSNRPWVLFLKQTNHPFSCFSEKCLSLMSYQSTHKHFKEKLYLFPKMFA